jgi:putative oxidoreductase
MRGIVDVDPGWGITAVRVAMAIVLIVAGWVKWFHWGVTTGVTANFTKYGFPVPEAFAFVAAFMELVGGVALLVGLFSRWLGLYFAVQFAIAFVFVKLRLATFAEGRLDLLLLAGGLLFFLAGPGRAALDERGLEKS